MTAYALAETRPLDPDLFERYKTLAAASIERHGGRYVVRGGPVETLEGEWPTDTSVIVVAFPTMADLRAWYGSADYAEALEVRRAGALERRLVAVDGVDATPDAVSSAE